MRERKAFSPLGIPPGLTAAHSMLSARVLNIGFERTMRSFPSASTTLTPVLDA
jgi:hypothetical protein